MTLLGKNDGAHAADGTGYLDMVSLIRKYGAAHTILMETVL